MWHPAAVSICKDQENFASQTWGFINTWNIMYQPFEINITIFSSQLRVAKNWNRHCLSYILARHLKLNFPFPGVKSKSSCKYYAEPLVLHNKIKARIGIILFATSKTVLLYLQLNTLLNLNFLCSSCFKNLQQKFSLTAFP